MKSPRISTASRFSLAVIFVPLLILGSWIFWCRTRTWVPVRMPISLKKANHIQTGEFSINLTDKYEISIEAENKLPLGTLICLLGIKGFHESKDRDMPSTLKLTWILSNNSETIAQGNSDETGGGAYSNSRVSRSIGYFEGKSGNRYNLKVDVLEGEEKLAAANPKLTVSQIGPFWESSLVMTGLLKLVCFIVAIIGSIMLFVSISLKLR